MIAVLLDQGLAPRAAVILRDRAFDAIHVMELGMAKSDDADILEMARDHNRVCVTLDHDFHTHLALAGQGYPSVILLRIEKAFGPDMDHLLRMQLAYDVAKTRQQARRIVVKRYIPPAA